jgi:hypothetical protein
MVCGPGNPSGHRIDSIRCARRERDEAIGRAFGLARTSVSSG